MAFRRAAAVHQIIDVDEAHAENAREKREILDDLHQSYYSRMTERSRNGKTDLDEEDARLQREEAYQRSRIAKLCTSVGHVVAGPTGSRFYKEDNCLKQLKKLRRAINKDTSDERADTIVQLGELHFVRDMLIPLARDSADDPTILLEVTKLAVMLTMLPSEGSLQADDKEEHRAKQIVARTRLQLLREYKALFLGRGVLSSFNALLHGPLMVPSERRTEEDKTHIELVLNLIRNLLAVPDQVISNSTYSSNAHLNNLQENFVLMLERESVIDVLLHLAECVGLSGNSDWNLILLDSFFHLFRGTSAEEVFQARKRAYQQHTQATTKGKGVIMPQQLDAQTEQLQSLLAKSKAKRSQSLGMASRHSRFGGVFKGPGNKVFQLANKLHQSTTSKTAYSTTALSQTKTTRRKKDESSMPAVVVKQTSSTIRSPRFLNALERVCSGLIEKCFKPLMTGLKKDVHRGDARVTPAETVQFLWLASYCMEFQRLDLQYQDYDALNAAERLGDTLDSTKLPSNQFDWNSSPLFVMMDKWSFQYVIKCCHAHYDESKWAALEVDIKLYREMMNMLLQMRNSAIEKCRKRGRRMQNSVFYELGEIEIIAQLLRGWTVGTQSHEFLVDLCFLVDNILDIALGMSEDGVVVQTARKRAKKKSLMEKEQGEPWGAEETHALVEGVREFGSSSKSFRKILKDKQLGQIFQDHARTFKQLAARWKYLNAKIDEGKAISEIIAEEASNPNGAIGDGTDNNQGEQDAEVEETLDQLSSEHEMNFDSFFRRFVANTSVANMVRSVDPDTSWFLNCTTSRKFHLHKVVGKFLDRVRDLDRGKADGNCEGMLWHIQTFSTYYRVLDASRSQITQLRERGNQAEFALIHAGTKHMVEVMQSTVDRFFEHAAKNPVAFVEVLFWRTKAENVAMSRCYNDFVSTRRRRRDEDALDEEEGYVNFARERGEGESDEEEVNFDVDDTVGETRNAVGGKRVNPRRTGEGRTTWTENEDAILRQKFPRLSLEFPDTVYELLSLEDELQEMGRTPAQIRVRVQDLLLRTLRPGESSNGSSQAQTTEIAAFPLDRLSSIATKFRRNVFDVISMTGPAKAVEASVSAAHVLSFLVQQLESAAEVRSAEQTGGANSMSRCAFAVVPQTEAMELWLKEPRVRQVMSRVGFRAPNRTSQPDVKLRKRTNARNERYWRVLEFLNSDILAKLAETLKNAVLDACTLIETGKGWIGNDSDSENDSEDDEQISEQAASEDEEEQLLGTSSNTSFYCWQHEPFLPKPKVNVKFHLATSTTTQRNRDDGNSSGESDHDVEMEVAQESESDEILHTSSSRLSPSRKRDRTTVAALPSTGSRGGEPNNQLAKDNTGSSDEEELTTSVVRKRVKRVAVMDDDSDDDELELSIYNKKSNADAVPVSNEEIDADKTQVAVVDVVETQDEQAAAVVETQDEQTAAVDIVETQVEQTAAVDIVETQDEQTAAVDVVETQVEQTAAVDVVETQVEQAAAVVETQVEQAAAVDVVETQVTPNTKDQSAEFGGAKDVQASQVSE